MLKITSVLFLAERDCKGKMKGTVKEKWKGVKAERDCKGKMKGAVKEKWKEL